MECAFENVLLALSGNSSATLHRISSGAHVDMESGRSYFSSAANSSVGVHADEELLRPAKNQLTQAQVHIFAQQLLQVSAIRGNLMFCYKGESRIIPEGETYRIYLDSETDTRNPTGAARPPSVKGSKIAIFVATGVATGLSAWSIHDLIEFSNGPESPAKP